MRPRYRMRGAVLPFPKRRLQRAWWILPLGGGVYEGRMIFLRSGHTELRTEQGPEGLVRDAIDSLGNGLPVFVHSCERRRA